jgi:GAF domain-containing protein
MASSTDVQTIRHLQSENVRLRSENNSMRNYVERLQRTLSALVDLQKNLDEINSETNIYLLIHNLLEAALLSLDSENGSLMLLDEETGELVFVEVIGQAHERLQNFRLPRGAGLAGWVIQQKVPKLVSDAKREPSIRMSVDQYTGFETQTLACVPLLDGNRRMGVIEVINTRSGRLFEDADLDVLQLVGRLASLALVEAEKYTA